MAKNGKNDVPDWFRDWSDKLDEILKQPGDKK